jgi:hypothetical protein
MYRSIDLAGFAAAQAVCCLFDRVPLVPLAFSRRAAGPPTISLLPAGTPDVIVAHGQQWLDANAGGADEAVFVCDGYATIAGTKKDALLLEIQSYLNPPGRMKMAIPYRHHHHPRGFAVHRPKFIVSRLDGHDTEALTQAFFRGVAAHDAGARIWNACVDQEW